MVSPRTYYLAIAQSAISGSHYQYGINPCYTGESDPRISHVCAMPRASRRCSYRREIRTFRVQDNEQ